MCSGTGLKGKGEDNQGPRWDLGCLQLTRDSKPTGAPSVAALEISAAVFAEGHNASYKRRFYK